MSNTSTNNDKTVGDDAKVKLIIGEIGRDTKTGIIGRGYSFDNGNTFHVTDTIFGRLYDDRDADGIWNNGMHEKVEEKVNQEITNTVEPAIKQADSAVAYANDAIEKSRVNQQAIVEINSAVSDAVSDAAVARSDGLRAWDAAQSNADLIDQNYASASAAISSARTEAIAAADEAKASASAAQADIVAVRSDVAAVQADVTATQSDVAVAKNDIVKAKSDATAGINAVKSDVAVAKSDITDTKTSLASQAKSLSSYAAQASAAGKDITTLKSQAGQFEQEMADTKGDVSQLKVSASSASAALSDAAGNISSLQASAKSYSAALSDTNSNVATVTATASELETKYADAAGDISQIKTDAKGTAETIADAQGDIASLKKRADGFDTQFTNAKSDIAVIQSDATGTKETLANTKSDVAVLQSRADGFDAKYSDVAGDVSTLQADAKGMTQTISNAQGDIAKLKTRADGFDTEFASTNGDISKLQVDASGTKQTLTNAKSDIAVLQSRADGFDTKYADVAGDINKLQVDASGMKQTLTDAQGNISTLQATATGFKNTLTDAQGNISTLQSDVAGLKKTTSDHAGNIATLQVDAKTLTSQMSSAQGDISTLKQTASGFSSKVSGMETSLANANDKLNSITSNGGGRNLAIGTDQEYTMGYGIPNTTWEDGYAYLKLPANTTDREVLPQYPHTFYHTLTKGTTYTQTIWFETDAKLGNSSGIQITWFTTSAGHDGQPATLINLGENKYKLYSTYMWPGKSDNSVRLFDIFYLDSAFDLSTGTYLKFGRLKLEDGIISTDWSPAPEDTDAKITTNSTAIEQNKKAIALKADQTTVDKANGDVALLKAQLKVQSDQINSKVSSSDLSKLSTSGRNYIKDSQSFTMTGNGTDYYDRVWSVYGDAFFANPLCHGTNKTRLSFDLTPSKALSTAKTYCIYWRAVPWTSFGTITVPAGTTDKQHYELAMTTPTTQNQASQIFMRFMADSTSDVSYTIEHSMLTISDAFAEWSPAPEDVQTYTQTQIKQTADSWNANLTSVKNGLTDKYTNLHATVDGIQAQVYNSDGSSKITQLSNLIATKVSSGDYNSQITQLKNDINLRVAKGNVVSQINQEAGGNTLIQVSNGRGKLALNASSVVFSGSAFIPDAAISTINADKLRFYDNSGNVATMSANLVQHDDDKVARTINLQYNGGYEVHASNTLGSILTMHDDTIRLAVKSSGSSGDQYSGVYAMTHYTQLSNYRSDGSAPGVFIYDDQFNILGDANGAGTSKGDMHISSPQLYLNGSSKLQAGGDHALLTIASDYTTIHADKNVWMETGNTQLHLDNSNNLEIFNKNNTNTSNYDVHLTVRGWATFTGWINCLGLTQTSRLSTKTNIERLDTARALELINSADVATYQYKQDVANGGTKRHASVIIDDVNDVARYQTPDEFISEDRSGRSDGDIVGYLMGAVQELTKKIKTLESKVG